MPNDQILEKVTLDVQSGANVFDVPSPRRFDLQPC